MPQQQANVSFLAPHPEYLHLPAPGGQVYCGCDQEWFAGYWQRKAGCGPSTLSNLVLYLTRAGKANHQPIPDKAAMTKLMRAMWDYVTPGLMGLNDIHKFASGGNQALKELGSGCTLTALDAGQPLTSLVEFITQGLKEGPVAFLNLARTQQGPLEPWHWMTLVGLDTDAAGHPLMRLYDNGKEISADLAVWHQRGTAGGFVRLDSGQRQE